MHFANAFISIINNKVPKTDPRDTLSSVEHTFIISGTEHPGEDNLYLHYWAEITAQQPQTFNQISKAIKDQYHVECIRPFCPPSELYPKRTMLNFRDRNLF